MLALEDVLTRDDGVVLPHLAESYQTLRRTSRAIGAAMDALKAPRSVVVTRAAWDRLGRTTPNFAERRAVLVAHLVRASRTCSIVRLVLQGTMLSGLEPGLLETIAGSSALRELDLGDNRLEADVGARLGAALGACGRLETLVLLENPLGQGCREVAAGLARCGELRRLDLGRCEVGRGGMEAIVRNCPGLERLELADNHIGAPGRGGGLARLALLDLSQNPLGRATEHAQGELPALLRGCPRLTELRLAGCGLRGPALAAALGACGALVTLDLSGNALGDADWATVAGLLARSPRLAELDVSQTGALTWPGSFALARALWGCRDSLRVLKLEGCVHDLGMRRVLMEAWMGPRGGLRFVREGEGVI
jgi:hypothetical protein